MDSHTTWTSFWVADQHRGAACRGSAAQPQRFERSAPNHLWQMDFKGPLFDAGPKRYLFTVLDDHSRYLLAVGLCADQMMQTAWATLWDVFGEAGLPESILSDNGFGPRGPSVGLDGRHYSHLLDPRSGMPAHAVCGATVVAPKSVTANALATILCVLGPEEGFKLVERIPGAECLLITSAGKQLRSRGFAALELVALADEK